MRGKMATDKVELALEFPKEFIEGLWAAVSKASTAIKEAAVIDLLRQ